MSIPLRDYQKETVSQFKQVLATGIKSVLIQQPTGAGKSVILAELIKDYLASGKRILLIAHKIELINQLYDHVHRWLNFKATIMANRQYYHYDPKCQVVIASIQSWSYRDSRSKPLPKADLVVVDEAHHCASNSYSRLFEYYKDSIRIGLTATPRRLDGKGLRYLAHGVTGFQYLIKGVHVRELMDDGFLSEYKLYGASNLLNADGKVGIRGGDYKLNELADFVGTQLSPQEVVDTWLRLAHDKKTVIYPVSVELSKIYCDCFNQNGVRSAHIDAKTPTKLRQEILNQFKNGTITVLCQHSIIIEGVDVPDIECVQFIRPTRSLVIWFQAIGRALRPAPNKPHAIIIDHTTTHQFLPLPDVPQKWSLDPDSYSGYKTHLKCNHCNHTWIPSHDRELQYFQVISTEYEDDVKIEHGVINPCYCRFCNHNEPHDWTIFTKPPTKEVLPKELDNVKDVTICEINTDPNPDKIKLFEELITHQIAKGYKPAWVGYRAMEIDNLSYYDFVWLAVKLGYKKGWASHRYQEYIYHTINKAS